MHLVRKAGNDINRIFIGRYDENSKETWIYQRDFVTKSELELYVSSMYFTVTTVLTVGYGDITAVSMTEKCFCVLMMLVGVFSFSFSTGTLSAIIQSIDERDSQLKEKISTLNEIKTQYNVDRTLFNKLVRTIQYDHRKQDQGISEFMEELPYSLQQELNNQMQQKKFAHVPFLCKRDVCFLKWISPIIQSSNYEVSQFVYKEGEIVKKSK